LKEESNQDQGKTRRTSLTVLAVDDELGGAGWQGDVSFATIMKNNLTFLALLAIVKYNNKEMSKKIAPAMNRLISEADIIAKGERSGATMSDIFWSGGQIADF